MTTVVIGVGNRDMGDDAIGPVIADAIAAESAPFASEVRALTHEGDLSLLPVMWEADDRVVIVDAVVGLSPAWHMTEIDPDEVVGGPVVSTHGLGVSEALALAARLDRMPAHLQVLGIGVEQVGPGPMTPVLLARVPDLATEVLQRLGYAAAR